MNMTKKMWRLVLGTALLLMVPTAASAEFRTIELAVRGMD
jgi:hypothetical protein